MIGLAPRCLCQRQSFPRVRIWNHTYQHRARWPEPWGALATGPAFIAVLGDYAVLIDNPQEAPGV